MLVDDGMGTVEGVKKHGQAVAVDAYARIADNELVPADLTAFRRQLAYFEANGTAGGRELAGIAEKIVPNALQLGSVADAAVMSQLYGMFEVELFFIHQQLVAAAKVIYLGRQVK